MDEFTSELATLLSQGSAGAFRAFAYYDKHLDCIRAQFFDCSFTERRLNRFITALETHGTGDAKYAGFNIKGVRSLFEKANLPMSGVIKLTTLVDWLVKFYPDDAARRTQAFFSSEFEGGDLEIVLS
jgi:hypothetical protein